VDVRYEDHDANFASDTKGLRVDMVPTGGGAGHLAGQMAPGATSDFKWEPRGTSLTLLGGRAMYTPELAGVENLMVRAREGTISTTVRFAFHGTDRLQLHARGEVRGESLKAWYPLLDTLSGPLALDFTMPSEGGAPAFADVRLTGTNISWRNLPVQNFDATGGLATGGITLSRLALRVAGGWGEGTGHLAWSKTDISHASMQWRDVDAGDVWKILFASSPGAVRVAPGSIVAGTFEGRWPGWDADRLEGRLETTWRRRPAGPRRGEILWYDGRIVSTFARGPWTIDVDGRADGALGLRGRLFTRGSGRDYGDWPITGRLALTGSSPDVFRDGLRLTGLELETPLEGAAGDLTGEAVLSRTFRRILTDVNFDASMHWADQPPVYVHAKASVDPDAVRVTEWTGESGPSRAQATALIDLNSDTIRADFTANDVPAESWTRRFDWPTIATGPLDVQGSVSGPLRRPLIAATVDGGPMTLVAINQGVDRVTGQVQFQDGSLRVDGIQLSQTGGGDVTGSVTYSTRTAALDASAEIHNYAFAARVPGVTTPEGTQAGDLRAVATGTVTVSGTSDTPTIEATFSSPQLALDGRSFGPVEGKATTANDMARIDLTAAQLGTRVTGTIGLGEERPFDLSGVVKTADSPLAAHLGAVDVEVGAMEVEAHATGRLNEPSLSSLDVTATRLDVSAAGISTTIQPGARVVWHPSSLEVTGLRAAFGNTTVAVSGALDGAPGHQLSAQLKGRLDDLRPAARAFLGSSFDRAVAEGPLEVTVTAAGTPDRPTVVGSLAVDAATMGDGVHPPLTNLWLRTVLDRSVVRFDLAELQWQGAHTAISGSIPAWFFGVPGATRDGRAALRGHLDDVTIKVLEPLVSADALGATDFNIRVEYSVEATAPTLEAIAAEARVTDAVIRSRDLSLEQQGVGRLTLQKGVATLEPWTVAAKATTTTQVTLGGSATLLGTPSVDAKVDGRLDLRTLSLLFGTYRPAGTAVVNARITGPPSKPNVDGFVTLDGAELLVRNPRLLLTDIHGTARFAGDQIAVERITGTVNGGTLDVTGSMRQPGRGTSSGALNIVVRGALFDIPRGFRSSADADLRFAGRSDGRYGITGTATITDAAYRESLLTGGLAALFRQQETLPAAAGTRQASVPSNLFVDIRVLANDSIVIDTSLARVALGTNLRVVGPISNIRLTGHADVAPGGQLFFGGHTYQIESGIFAFRAATLRPDVRLVAHTTAGGYEITMRVESREGNVETTLSSDPPLPEDDIASLMLSGQRTTSGSAGEVVTAQLLQALSGEIVGAVGRAIGFDAVRVESGNPANLLIDPSLLSSTSKPTQRVTFSKRVLPDLEVIFSQSLSESGDITWIVAYEPIPHFEFRFVQLDNRDKSYEFRNDLYFGGGESAANFSRRRPTEAVRDVYVAVFGGITEDEVRKLLRVTEGRHFDFYKWQGDRDRLQKLFVERGFFEARLTARRDPSAPSKPKPGTLAPVDLGYTIETGPPTELRITGMDLPNNIRKTLIQLWQDTPVDSLLGDEFTGRLRPWLAERGYLRPTIATRIDRDGQKKIAKVTITPGEKYDTRLPVFSGNDALDAGELKRIVAAARIEGQMWSEPTLIEQAVADAYRARGYRAVKVTASEPRLQGTRAELPVSIVEGPLYKIGGVKVEAPRDAPRATVDLTPPVEEGDAYTDSRVADAIRQMQSRFRRAGYRGTRVTAQSTPHKDDPSTVDLTFSVAVGRRLTIGEVKVAGVTGSRERLVTRMLPFASGQPVLLDDLTRTRDRIYDTDVFRSVDIEATPRPAPEGGQPSSIADVMINLTPLPKYRLRYGFQLYDPTTPAVNPKWGTVDPGVVADLTRRGLFGRGITAGVGVRLNPSNRLARTYVSTRNFFTLPLETTVYYSDQWQRAVSFSEALEGRTREITFEQRYRQRRVQFAYGYDFEKIRTDELLDLPPLTEPVPTSIRANVGRAFASAVVDARDNVIDPRRGWFHSSSYEIAPEWLGSTLGFRKYLGQQFVFLRAPGTSVVLGSAARFEIATGPGQDFIITERLRAGGANTVRGYDDVILGQLTTPGDPNPKTGLVVLNQELRFPLFWRFRGAGFYDHAVLFGDIEFQGERNRNSIGGGLRLTFPFIVFRVDYGYPLSKDAQNQDGRWYFSIGQAF
jgi:outer membrane protein assembly factor BamA